jgi:hypothetical protein
MRIEAIGILAETFAFQVGRYVEERDALSLLVLAPAREPDILGRMRALAWGRLASGP